MDSLCECLTVDMNFSSLLSTLLLLFRLAMTSTLELKEDKMLKVQFVGDDDVLNHILDREGGIKWLYNRRDVYLMVMCYFTFKSLIIYFENIAQSIWSSKTANKYYLNF